MKILCHGVDHVQLSGTSKSGNPYSIDQVVLHCEILDKTRSREFTCEFGNAVYKFIIPIKLYEDLNLPADFSKLKNKQLDITFVPSYNGKMEIDTLTIL